MNHIVHEIARLVALNGERRLREQYEEIIGLSESASSESYRKGSNPSQLDPVRPDSEDDWDRIHQVNAELRDRMSTMRSTLHQIEEKRHDEVRVVTEELSRYKELLGDTEKRLITERVLNRKLKTQLDKLSFSRHTSRSHSCRSNLSDDCDSGGHFGYGALTVRSCHPPTARPMSAKSRKHRHMCLSFASLFHYGTSPPHCELVQYDHPTRLIIQAPLSLKSCREEWSGKFLVRLDAPLLYLSSVGGERTSSLLRLRGAPRSKSVQLCTSSPNANTVPGRIRWSHGITSGFMKAYTVFSL